MALPATANFNGSARHTQLTTHSASWTLCMGDFDIQAVDASALASDATGPTGAGWNADAFNANQYAQGTLVALGNYVYIGVAVRCDVATPDDDFYGFYSDATDGCYLTKMLNGSETVLGSKAAAFSVSDVIRLEADGTTITPKKNGSTTGTPGAQTDSAIASGAAGVSGYDDSEASRIDDWEGGNLGAAAGKVKKLTGIAWASVKKVTGVAVASVKKIEGVEAQ